LKQLLSTADGSFIAGSSSESAFEKSFILPDAGKKRNEANLPQKKQMTLKPKQFDKKNNSSESKKPDVGNANPPLRA